MFKEREIIYFTPFYFKNGNQPKPKYMLVLKWDRDKGVLASLPSSKDFVPTFSDIEFGCIELPEANFNSFVIKELTEVTECGKSFELKTFLYGHLLDYYDKNYFDIYPHENINFERFGIMQKELYNQIIKCFKNSDSVKNKFKKIL